MPRTIQTFFKSEEKEKTSQMMSDICLGTRRSLSTVYKWMSGERVPCYLEQVFIQKVVKKIFNELVPLDELFTKGALED